MQKGKFTPRSIVHPVFRNVTFQDAETALKEAGITGEVSSSNTLYYIYITLYICEIAAHYSLILWYCVRSRTLGAHGTLLHTRLKEYKHVAHSIVVWYDALTVMYCCNEQCQQLLLHQRT